MPIKIPDSLPAKKVLERENIFVMTEYRAMHQDIRPLNVLILNLMPNKEIKPRTYQMKPRQSLLIGNYARIDYLSDDKNSFTLYLSNNIKVDRINLNTNDKFRDLNKISFDLDNNKDIVINGLLFCKITKKAKVNIYTKDNVRVYERDNLI